MTEGVKENGLEDSDKVVRSVLNQRHMQEMNDLERQFTAEKKMAVDEALNTLVDTYDRKREELMKKHDAQLQALQVCTTYGVIQKSCDL